jgi:hypothetical protein
MCSLLVTSLSVSVVTTHVLRWRRVMDELSVPTLAFACQFDHHVREQTQTIGRNQTQVWFSPQSAITMRHRAHGTCGPQYLAEICAPVTPGDACMTLDEVPLLGRRGRHNSASW